jgi:hypothetical protein
MPLIQPLVNGYRYDFTSIELVFDGFPVIGDGFSSISYDDTNEPGVVGGASAMALGLTPGTYSAEGEIEMLKEEEDELLNVLVTLGGGGIYDARFGMNIGYAEVNSPARIDELVGCRLKKISYQHQRGGNDGLKVRHGLYVQYIIRNGKLPLSPLRMAR